MNKITEHEDEARNLKEDFSPLAMRLFKDYRHIAQGCIIEFNGDNGFALAAFEVNDYSGVGLTSIL
ncbi:hypothetical protein HAX54_029305, partial [Datura stramonium]|nr:hypothetical protein [Datura stramonium]